MAAFPVYPLDVTQSVQEPVDDLQVDEWPNGSFRGRSYFTTGRYQWQLVMPALTEAEKGIVKTFYDANRLLGTTSYVSPWDGVTYTDIGFLQPPQYRRIENGYWRVTVAMRQMV